MKRLLAGIDGLVDIVAQAIRNQPGDSELKPWDRLDEEQKRGWRGDAERALAVVKESLTADPINSELLDALRVLVTANLPGDDPDFIAPPESPMGIAISAIYAATGAESIEDVKELSGNSGKLPHRARNSALACVGGPK